ncbi:hypothetical protein DdX_19709 [Ditylenchus destructor]|uniref:F-box domain-containing protein n=1 Tax=Ditylenchus destructor TaxID=166010 RepID=A0AAD4MIJ0_9BILA|nr:hypothetical protein DdX_19709 [Ditylenchus destructor]
MQIANGSAGVHGSASLATGVFEQAESGSRIRILRSTLSVEKIQVEVEITSIRSWSSNSRISGFSIFRLKARKAESTFEYFYDTMPSKGVKRSGSHGGGAFEREAKKKSRTPVEIADDAWLEILRSLSFRQCAKVRLVSRQINGVAQRNISTLPCAIIDSAITRLRERNKVLGNIIVLDSTIRKNDAIQWFKDRGIAMVVPKDIQLDNAIIDINLEEDRCVDITVLGSAPQKKLARSQASRNEVVFYAEFRPKRNENSWATMTHFLQLLYHPVTYIKELSMYSLDKKLKDTLFGGEERYIRCGLFTFQMATVEKFRTVVSIPSTFPAIVISGNLTLGAGDSLNAPLSGTDVIEECSDNSGGGSVYVVSNGQNRMRVEFSRKYPNDSQGLRRIIACGPGGCRGYASRKYDIRVEVYAV